MRILIAPDKFKGALGARDVAECIAMGLRDVLPDAAIDLMPVADGGEGTAEVIGLAHGGEWIVCDAHDALGRPIQARYVWLESSAAAVMEMSEAAGLWRIAADERNPLKANTAGVGEMFLNAVARGAKKIIVGLGGSATNDGGFGMARALGYRFYDSENVELKDGPAELVRLTKIRCADRELVSHRRLVAASDVRNPLLGDQGATRTFGRQKGAMPEQLDVLEQALTRLADVVARDLGVDYRDVPGAGAAGGLGFGLISFCGATIRSGFEIVSEMIDLEAAVQRADVVITGEGTLDGQTLEGKAPAGVARLARSHGKPVFAIVGCAVESDSVRAIFDAVFPLVRGSITREEAISRTRDLLRERGRELGRALLRP
jgi:glycerate kinase